MVRILSLFFSGKSSFLIIFSQFCQKQLSTEKIQFKFNVPFHKPISKIEKGLYLGDIIDADNKTLLKKLKITHILNISKEADCFHPKDFKYFHMRLEDHESIQILPYLDKITNFIEEGRKNGAILVHCVYGISRAATAVIAFLMKFHSMSYLLARKYVEKKRPHIYPNTGFAKQLKQWQPQKIKTAPRNPKENVKLEENKNGYLGGMKNQNFKEETEITETPEKQKHFFKRPLGSSNNFKVNQ